MTNADKIENAKKILTYYMRQAWEASGLKWDSDNDTEVVGIIDDILEQMKEMFYCGERVAEIREEKLERQIGRIRKRQTEKEEMTSAEAIERLERYRKGAEADARSIYDMKLHNACIKALRERMEREGSGNGI